jgi:hypothetical protein
MFAVSHFRGVRSFAAGKDTLAVLCSTIPVERSQTGTAKLVVTIWVSKGAVSMTAILAAMFVLVFGIFVALSVIAKELSDINQTLSDRAQEQSRAE